MNKVLIKDTVFGGKSLGIIAGPCVIESADHAIKIAVSIKEITDKVGLKAVYKSSFDKANRSSITSFTVQHSRSGVDTELVKNARIPHQDAMSFIDGRLVMETGDILKIQGDNNNTMKCIISILENAK